MAESAWISADGGSKEARVNAYVFDGRRNVMSMDAGIVGGREGYENGQVCVNV